jgi:hypothetical protein
LPQAGANEEEHCLCGYCWNTANIQCSGITDFDAIAVFDLIARMAPVD